MIIPEYRSVGKIYEAISSTFEALKPVDGESEVIVVLDGSGIDFDFNKICEEDCKKFNFKLIRLPINMGGAAARNCGLSSATGEYIQFLDSDDLIFPDAIKKKLDFSELSDENCICYGVSRTLDETENIVGYVSGAESLLEISDVKTYLGNNIQTSLPLYRRTLLDSVNGFDSSLRMGQEFNLNLRLIAQGVTFKNCRVLSTLIRQRHDYSIGSGFYQNKFPLAKLYFLISLEIILDNLNDGEKLYLFESFFDEGLRAKKNKNLILFDLAYSRCKANSSFKFLYAGSIGCKIKYIAVLFFGKHGFSVVNFLRFIVNKTKY
ncbi:glycosyltransferase family 2 protein [Coleofasciculus sp. LEGE 07081]|nr:glycosyltransferase family 2 protein [Coleofasciculus sp. LEGE 07081]